MCAWRSVGLDDDTLNIWLSKFPVNAGERRGDAIRRTTWRSEMSKKFKPIPDAIISLMREGLPGLVTGDIGGKGGKDAYLMMARGGVSARTRCTTSPDRDLPKHVRRRMLVS